MIHVNIEKAPTHVAAQLSGELTLATREKAAEALKGMLEEDASAIAIDLAGLKYIDSSGLGMLVDFNARANMTQTRLLLVAPSPFVVGVLENTRLNRWFEIATTNEEAVARITAARSA